MIECPELSALEAAPLAPGIESHLESCESCRLVVSLYEQTRGVAEADRDCSQFDALLAARRDGTLGRAAANLLARHLASCEACRAVEHTLSPTTDAHGDHSTFPRVDPGAYALGLEIGRGGMGRILSARDLRVGRPVAVKELLSRAPRLAARFEREARVTARLQHPGIVPIYEVGRWPDGTPFYSMRMYEGRTLREALDKAGSLAARISLLPAAIAASEAVAFAHGQRVIHRDLTPSNVMVGAYGETVVIDWGLAKDLAEPEPSESADLEPHPSDSAELTNDGVVLGTVAYMPPEQANAQPVDERADVYALGAILYHVLAGVPPYRVTPSSSLLVQVKAGPPVPVEQLVEAAPRDLSSIVAKAMARDPADRYPTARELVDELKRFQTGRIVEAHEYTPLERVRRFITRNRAPVVVTAFAVLLLGVLGAIAVGRVLRERKVAEATVRTLLEEEGRVELLAGNSLRALAYLDAAFNAADEPSAALEFMRAVALRDISTIEGDLDCGGYVRDLNFAPDGLTLVATCNDRAKLWRLADRSPVATLGPFVGGFAHLAYSHDGKTLVTWGADGVARLWDAASGRLLRSLLHAADVTITFATFTPDDRLVSTSGHDGWAKLWNAETGQLVRSIRGSSAPLLHHLYGLFSHDGKHLLTLTIEGIGIAWDVATGQRAGSFEHGAVTLGGELWKDGPRAVTCGMDRLVKVWNTETGALVAQLSGATNVVWACRFSNDGTRVLGSSHDHRAYVWDVASGAAIASVDHGSPVWMSFFSPDGTQFVTISLAGSSVKVWDARTGDLLAGHLTHGGGIAKFSPDGTRLVAALGDGRIRIWRGSERVLRASYTTPVGEALLAVNGDGSRAAIASANGSVAIRDMRSGTTIATPPLRAPIAASSSSFVGTVDGGAIVLHAVDGRTNAVFPLHATPRALALTADGHRVVVELADRDVEVWDVDRRARLVTLTGARHAVASHDGRRALAWSDDGAVIVWDVDAQRTTSTLAVSGAFEPIGFAAGGHRVVLVQRTQGSQRVTIWNADTGASLATLDGSLAHPTLDPTATRLTVIRGDQRVEIWNLLAPSLDRPDTAFISDQLQHAQLAPAGDLVAAVDGLGETVLVMAATDGRVLARWRIAHDTPVVSQDGFDSPRASVSWSSDGKTIVMTSVPEPARVMKAAILGSETAAHLAAWNVDTHFYDTDGRPLSDSMLASLVRRNVPWQVRGGRLEPALARLHGRVVRAGVPAAGVTIGLVFRKPPDLDGEIMRSQVTIVDKPLDPLVVDAAGGFSRELAPGRYTLTVAVPGGAQRTIELDLTVGDGPREIAL